MTDVRPDADAEERKLEAVIANIGVGVVVCDGDHRVTLANEAAESALGIPADRLIGRPLADSYPASYHAELSDALRQLAKATAEEKPFHEMVVTRGIKTIKCSAYPIDCDSSTLGTVILLQDITRDVELSEAKTQFISSVAHELRTPLTSLKGSIGLVLGRCAGEMGGECRDMLGIAQRSCDRLIRLVDEMLDLARAEAGALALRLDVVSVGDCVRHAAQSLRQYATDRDVRLALRVSEDLPPVAADPDRIEQVAVNLIANAIKFSPAGGTVTVGVKQLRGHVRVSVADEGPGIPEEDRERVFDKFYRASDTAGGEPGVGLGLAISKAIIDQHGGRIFVRGRRGRAGSTFAFTLPMPGGDGLLTPGLVR